MDSTWDAAAAVVVNEIGDDLALVVTWLTAMQSALDNYGLTA